MKIGQIASKYNITIDAVRHYINIGLLTPLKKGGQFDFDIRTEDDLKMILELKSHGFSLMEIKKIILYKNMTTLIYDNEDSFKKNIYMDKVQRLQEEIGHLSEIVGSLNDKIRDINESTKYNRQAIGFPLEALSLFQCPKCSSKLELNSSVLIKGQVFQGELLCECGYQLPIQEGIVVAESSRELGESLYKIDFTNYVEETPVGYVNELHKASIWLSDIFAENNYQGKVILDVGTGHGIFVRNIYQALSEDCLLICNDVYKEKIDFIKEALEMSGIKHKVVFLACDARFLPLKDNCIDIISALTTSIHLLKVDEILITCLERHLKQCIEIYIGHMVFEAIDPTNSLACQHRESLSKAFFDTLYESKGLTKINQYRSSYLPFCGKYETLISKKDKVYMYCLYLTRSLRV